MAETIKIEVFKNKAPEEFTKALADPDSRLESGGGAAMTAAVSAALLQRAAELCARTVTDDERLDYICRNSETLRQYMVHLIDEDVRCRGPLRRALSEGDARKIDAAGQSAVSICGEIVNMMGKLLELLTELKAMAPAEARHYLRESAEAAMGASRMAVHYILDMSQRSSDETYRFISRRENEITMGQLRQMYEQLLSTD